MSELKQNSPPRVHLGRVGWVLDLLKYFSLIAICPGL
jgi:hypothetical protein